MTPIYHGGALDLAIAQYGGNKQDWLDLSTGINPYHYPINQIDISTYTNLPQQADLQQLIIAAKHAYQCDQGQILVVNGTQKIIEILPQIFKKSTIAILTPTYEEHAHNWQKNGHQVILTDNIAHAKTADHLLVVNPNNPTGKQYKPDEMMALHQHFANKGGHLIIDEAFMDCQPEFSMAHKAGMENLIILRSFGKFYGLAGIRIGFILADKKIINQMSLHFGLWGIAGPALQLATQALMDDAWQQAMRTRLSHEMQQMQHLLTHNGFNIIGSTNLFCLVKMPNQRISAHKYFAKFCESHILCRKFNSDDTILRFGLVEDVSKQQLQTVIKQVLSELNR